MSKLRVRIFPFTKDLRTYEQQAEGLVREIERIDAPTEQLFRHRVAANESRRRRRAHALAR